MAALQLLPILGNGVGEMRYLLYCIFPSRRDQDRKNLLGVGRQPVLLISKNGLTAAVSRIAPSDLVADVQRLLAYERVIESFHRDRTIIPMRYGCLLEEESQVLRLLEERSGQCHALLEEIEGCVEMGIRALISDSTSPIPQPLVRTPQSATSGRAYLAERKAHYEQEEMYVQKVGWVAQWCRASLAGLFVKCKTEYSPIRNPLLLSLYFLVARGSVECFRKGFQHISIKAPARLLLSGPWPPYNFVVPCYCPDRAGP